MKSYTRFGLGRGGFEFSLWSRLQGLFGISILLEFWKLDSSWGFLLFLEKIVLEVEVVWMWTRGVMCDSLSLVNCCRSATNCQL